MYDYVLFSYILDYSCFPFLLPTSTLVFRYFNLKVVGVRISFGIFSGRSLARNYLIRLDLTLDALLAALGWPWHFRRDQPFYCN